MAVGLWMCVYMVLSWWVVQKYWGDRGRKGKRE